MKTDKKEMTKAKQPLNQILFGPPGTGKTYNTINRAIEIINPDFDLEKERTIVKEEYDRLVEAGQIVFTTFHQSMSYEDFVEGIKPKLDRNNDEQLEYVIEPGTFKVLSLRAKENWEKMLEKNDEDSERIKTTLTSEIVYDKFHKK